MTTRDDKMDDLAGLNLAELRKLPTYELPPSYHLGTRGMGCYGDPPGFPTYHLRPVWTRYGNHPRRGAGTVITVSGVNYVISRAEWKPGDTWDQRSERQAALMMRLWSPLPYASGPVQEWIADCYRHWRNCYMDDLGLVADATKSFHDRLIIYPVPSYNLRSFHDDPRFSEEWRVKEQAAVEAYNADIRERTARVAIPENHAAYRRVVKFYPEHTPDLEKIG